MLNYLVKVGTLLLGRLFFPRKINDVRPSTQFWWLEILRVPQPLKLQRSVFFLYHVLGTKVRHGEDHPFLWIEYVDVGSVCTLSHADEINCGLPLHSLYLQAI